MNIKKQIASALIATTVLFNLACSSNDGGKWSDIDWGDLKKEDYDDPHALYLEKIEKQKAEELYKDSVLMTLTIPHTLTP